MPIAVAAPVLVFMPISWSASPRVRVMSSPGRASEPTARTQTTSGLTSTASARSTFTSSTSVLFTAESGTTSAATASTAPIVTTRISRGSRRLIGPLIGRPSVTSYPKTCHPCSPFVR